mmetsp:Transcript_10501/g.29885  ORF Transcript_10501/g.29885 Transcript_10501/m.29885 type:complete len:191 (-) Transcript_10501:261-833(-)
MTTEIANETYIPAQHEAHPRLHDFRGTETGPRGYKLRNSKKRGREEIDMEPDTETQDAGQDMDTEVKIDPMPKRLRTDVQRDVSGLGASSKRSWKEPLDKVKKSVKPTSWEKKMTIKAQTKVFTEHKKAAIGEYKAKWKAVADQRKAAAQRKEENRKKSEIVQVIKNPATLKRMMKNRKQKAKLVTRDTN